LCLFFFAVNVSGQEKQLKRSDLPPAVQQTAHKESKGATIRGYTSEIEDGKLEYEVATIVNDRTRNVTIDPDGKVLEIDEEVALDTVPATVREGLQQKAGNGRITKVVSVRELDAPLVYEAKVLTAGKKSEIEVGGDGKVIEVEQEVDLKTLPAKVREGLQHKAGKGKITKVASITKRDAVVAYEADVLTADEKLEVQVGPDGKSLDHEE
jgi:hypothetical protein